VGKIVKFAIALMQLAFSVIKDIIFILDYANLALLIVKFAIPLKFVYLVLKVSK